MSYCVLQSGAHPKRRSVGAVGSIDLVFVLLPDKNV